MKLTPKTIDASMKACQGEVTLNDGNTERGAGSLVLVLRRLADETVSAQWFAKWKKNGQRKREGLGRYPAVSLKQARELAAKTVAERVAGKATSVSDGPPTVERLFKGYITSMRAKGRRSADQVESVLLTTRRNAADKLGRNRMAGDITSADIQSLLAAIYGRRSRVMADRTRAYIHAAYAWGMKAALDYTVSSPVDWGIKANPVTAIPRDHGASTPRERDLSADELRKLWHGCDGDGFQLETTAAVRMLILCGQRVRETLRAEGAHFDLKAATWSLPSWTTKGDSGRHVVPLPAQAVPVIRELIDINGADGLFPARRGSTRFSHIGDASVNRALRRWSK